MNALRQVSSPMYLVPAYGARYDDVQAMRKAWEDGEDFRMGTGGPYASIRDLDALKADASTVWLTTHDLCVRVA